VIVIPAVVAWLAMNPGASPAAEGQNAQAPRGASLPANADGRMAAQYLWDTIPAKCEDPVHKGEHVRYYTTVARS